jgi:pyridoxal 5'-phosphate synthase pdxT subunit
LVTALSTGAGTRLAAGPRRGPRVGVLALQGDVREHVRMVRQLGASPVEVKRPGDLDDVEGLVLPGGESTTMSMLLESSELFEPLSALIRGGLPVLGTCAGMILLAKEVVGGRPDQRGFAAIDISVRRNGFGRQAESFEADLDIEALGPPPMRAVFIRAPYVEKVGSSVEVLASVRGGGDAGGDAGGGSGGQSGGEHPVLCREGRITVAAFHPELAGDARLHQLLLSDVRGD